MTYIGFYSRFLTFDALYLQNRLSSEEYVRRVLERQNDTNNVLSSTVKTWADAKKALNPQ